MGKSAIIGIIIAVIVVAGGALALTHKSNKSSTTPSSNTNSSSSSNTSTPTSSTNSNSSSSTDQNAGATISYSDSGFSPSTLTVKAGTKVTIKNTSSNELQFDSNPHPVHTDDPELNIGSIAAGQSASFTPTTTGTHGYHNHLDPSQTGTLIVN